jgi:hypothetical protein
MTRQGNSSEIAERLAIMERGLTEVTARVGELASALAELAHVTGPTDAASTQPIVLGADDISPFAAGFYQREFDSADRPYRWTGRGSFFEMRIRLNRNFEWSFNMELQRNRHVNISKLRGYVDYIEIPVQANGADGNIRGVIPSKPFGNSAVLTFQLPNLFVPNQIDPDSPDNRTLGVVFYEFQAEPGAAVAKKMLSIARPSVPAIPAPSPLKGSVSAGAGSAAGNTNEPASKPRRTFAESVSRLKISI